MPIGIEEMRAGFEELTRIVSYHLRSAQQALDCLNELHQRLQKPHLQPTAAQAIAIDEYKRSSPPANLTLGTKNENQTPPRARER